MADQKPTVPEGAKLFNVIVVYDVYAVAHDFETATAAVKDFIQNGELPPSESKALGVRREVEVREAWRNEKPFVGADVTDDEFEKIKGKTTIETYNLFNKK